jgi:serine/threonine-protein kinase
VTALDVLVQLAGALQAAHEHGVVHRDLKPENVFVLDRGGRSFVKLVDFGIAKLADRISAHTAAGVIVGTPEYMAPEQCDNRPIDRRTDVYALGVMAYELATGRLPFEDASIPRLLLAQLRTAPRPPREVDPAIGPELEAAILKAMAKAPDDRFQDMRAFAAALEGARMATLQRAMPRAPPPAAPAATPAAQPARAPTPREVDVTVVARDGRPRALRAREATRGGVFLRGSAPLPPLRSEVRLSLEVDGGRRVDVAGEVVRHVSAADAARWNMPEGFAVAFHDLTPDQRGALDALAARLAQAPAATPLPARALTPAAFDELERRAASGPYEALGARPEAGFPEIRDRARATRQLVDALRPVLADAQASRVPALLARIDAALAQLGTPAERLLVDARLGNFQGVAHCVTAGVPAGVLASRRQAFLRANPDRAQRAQRHLARAQVAGKLGNRAAALAEYAEALRADPLDLAVHQAYWDLERAKR